MEGKRGKLYGEVAFLYKVPNIPGRKPFYPYRRLIFKLFMVSEANCLLN